MFVGLDPTRTRTLAQSMRRAGVEINGIVVDVEVALALSGLTSTVPRRLTIEADDLAQVGAVLVARADLADGFQVDLKVLAAELGISRQAAADAVAALNDPDADPDGTPLLDAASANRSFTSDLPTSTREVMPTLPAEGDNAELDAAIERFDQDLLFDYLNGDGIDPAELTEQQQADMEVIAAAMGGEQVTVSRTRTEIYRGARGDDEYRKVTDEIPITDLGPELTTGYVLLNLATGGLAGAAATGRTQRTQDGQSGRGDDNDPFDRGGLSLGPEEDGIREAIDADITNLTVSYDPEVPDIRHFEATDSTGRTYDGRYRQTKDGFQVDTSIQAPTGEEANLTYDKTATHTNSSFSTEGYATTTRTDNKTGVGVTHNYTPRDRGLQGQPISYDDNDPFDGGFDPTDVDNDGIDDRSDPVDNSGDPNGGFDGAI